MAARNPHNPFDVPVVGVSCERYRALLERRAEVCYLGSKCDRCRGPRTSTQALWCASCLSLPLCEQCRTEPAEDCAEAGCLDEQFPGEDPDYERKQMGIDF